MGIEIEDLDPVELKQAYEKFLEYENKKLIIKEGIDSNIESMKKRLADLMGLVNKKNEIDPKKVKGAVLKKAIVTYLDKINKIEIELELMEQYLSHLNNGDVPKTQTSSYATLIDKQKENNAEYKSQKKDAAYQMDESIVNAISYIANQSAIKAFYPNSEDKEKPLRENESDLIKEHYRLVTGLKKIVE